MARPMYVESRTHASRHPAMLERMPAAATQKARDTLFIICSLRVCVEGGLVRVRGRLCMLLTKNTHYPFKSTLHTYREILIRTPGIVCFLTQGHNSRQDFVNLAHLWSCVCAYDHNNDHNIVMIKFSTFHHTPCNPQNEFCRKCHTSANVRPFTSALPISSPSSSSSYLLPLIISSISLWPTYFS